MMASLYHVEAQAKASEKFIKASESPFGVTVQTKHGAVQIRQKRDSQGRVRRLFVSGRGFSELQMDENGDGAVDYLQVSKGTRTVTVTQPYRGRFLRLLLSESNKAGRLDASYILDANRRKYSLVEAKFFTRDAVLNFESGAPQEIEEHLAPKSGAINEDVENTPEDSSYSQSVELPNDEIWRNYQAEILGPDLLCSSDQSPIGRLAKFQRQWWQALKGDYDDNFEKLDKQLSQAKFFDESCRKPENKENFNALTKALAKVIMSSSKGQSSVGAQTRGRFLQCLELSGLGQVAAKIEMHFLQKMDGDEEIERPLKCNFRPGLAGISEPGFMNPSSKQITIQLAAADQSKTNPTEMGSPINYENILFHELIHVAGVASEEMTHAAQACCGDPSVDRPGACAKLDNIVLKDRRFNEIEAFLRHSGRVNPIYSDLYQTFKDTYVDDLYRKFLLGLDHYRKGSDFKNGLLDNDEFNECLKSSSETECRDKWTRHIADYTADFFQKECVKHVPADKRKDCVAYAKNTNFKNEMATAISHSLIRLSTDPVEPGERAFCEANAGYELFNTPKRALARFLSIFGVETAYASEQTGCEGNPGIQTSDPPQPISSLPVSTQPGEAPRAENIIDVSNSPNKDSQELSNSGGAPKGRIVPNKNDRDNAAGGNSPAGGDRAVGSAVGARPTRDSYPSPLPVSEVSSPGGARNTVDRAYRRVTDVAGLANKGLRDLRESILPKAIAAEGNRRGDVNKKSSPDFIAFRPSKEDIQATKMDNPFSGGATFSRSLSDVASNGASGSSRAGPADFDLGSSPKMNLSAFVKTGAKPINSKTGALERDRQAVTKNPDTPVSDPARANLVSDHHGFQGTPPATSDPTRVPANVDIDGILKMRYRDIERRLNEMPVQQALIDKKIQIIRANGAIVGAKRDVRICFKYAGQDNALKSPCE